MADLPFTDRDANDDDDNNNTNNTNKLGSYTLIFGIAKWAKKQIFDVL